MPVVVIANPKGGVGKSPLSTQVAGYFASKGHATMLGDTNRHHGRVLCGHGHYQLERRQSLLGGRGSIRQFCGGKQ